jgi:hypothetical protein
MILPEKTGKLFEALIRQIAVAYDSTKIFDLQN